mgnify:CR=1 FL=1
MEYLEGIYLNVEMLNLNHWVFSISLKNGVVYGPKQDSRYTREESEIDGFHDCFRILDKQIKDQNLFCSNNSNLHKMEYSID